MKGNPKSETRNPKEGRIPKAENGGQAAGVGYACGLMESGFWTWGDEAAEAVVLHEDAEVRANRPYDLEERTALFGEQIIAFAKKIPQNPVTTRLVSQLVAAGTSVGANYCEADDSVSGKEFKLRIGTCRKESKEAMFFLRMIAAADPTLTDEARRLWREAKELNLIFGAIWRK